MKIKINAALRVAALLCAMLFLSGCWNSRGLDKLGIMMGIGIDQSPIDNEQMEITAQLAIPSGLKTEGASEMAYWNVSCTANDMFYGLREMSHQVSRKIYIPHNQVIIFGEDFGVNGIQRALDFFMRDHEARLEVLVLTARGKAADILDTKPFLERVPSIDLTALMRNQRATSHVMEVRLADFITAMMSDTTAALMPIVQIIDSEEQPKLAVKGMAVYKKDRYVGDLDVDETRGMMWVLDKINSGSIPFEAPGGRVVLEITQSKTKLDLDIGADNTITLKVKINQQNSIASQSGVQNLTDKTGITLLNRLSHEVVEEEIKSAMKRSHELQADIFGVGELLHKKDPKLWEKLKDNWDKVYPTVQLEVEIDSRIITSGRLTTPARPGLE